MSSRYLKNVLSRQVNSKTILRCLEDVLCRLGSAQVSFEFPSSIQVPLECFLSALRVKIVSNITGNGLLHGFIEFFENVSEYMFCITLFVDRFLRNKMPRCYHVLPAR